jgi:hypothetical protein
MNDVTGSPVPAQGHVVEQDANLRPGTGLPGRARTTGRRPKLSREQQTAIVDAVR